MTLITSLKTWQLEAAVQVTLKLNTTEVVKTTAVVTVNDNRPKNNKTNNKHIRKLPRWRGDRVNCINQ